MARLKARPQVAATNPLRAPDNSVVVPPAAAEMVVKPAANAPVIEVSQAYSWGKKIFYPQNELARTFIAVCRREKALMESDIISIKKLGYRIMLVPAKTEPIEI